MVERLDTIPITCRVDGQAHDVTDENFAASQRTGWVPGAVRLSGVARGTGHADRSAVREVHRGIGGGATEQGPPGSPLASPPDGMAVADTAPRLRARTLPEVHARRQVNWHLRSMGDHAAYDRWRDAVGRHLPDGCRVEQVDVDRAHGALRHRLCTRGEVIRRDRDNRLVVHFDGEDEPVSIRPHLLRMLTTKTDIDPPRGIEHIIEELEQLRDLVNAPAIGDGHDR